MAADCIHFAENSEITNITKSWIGSWLKAGESLNFFFPFYYLAVTFFSAHLSKIS